MGNLLLAGDNFASQKFLRIYPGTWFRAVFFAAIIRSKGLDTLVIFSGLEFSFDHLRRIQLRKAGIRVQKETALQYYSRVTGFDPCRCKRCSNKQMNRLVTKTGIRSTAAITPKLQ